MIKAIVYTSNTGFTKRYAKMFAEKTGLALYNINDAKALPKNSEIIYFGWLFASNVKDYKKAAKRYDVKALCGVGLCPTGELLKEVRAATKLPESIPLFTVQGGMRREELRGINKFMINMLVKMLSSKKDATEEDKAQLELIQKGGDYVDENNLSAIYDWYNEFTLKGE